MRLSRARFTIRRIMAAVALVTLLLGLGRMWARYSDDPPTPISHSHEALTGIKRSPQCPEVDSAGPAGFAAPGRDSGLDDVPLLMK
jgi:hypothetical protein